MKSSIAAPSLRNSGLEQTWNGVLVWRAISARTRSAVPTGTVLFVTTSLGPFIWRPIVRAASSTCCTSAEPSSSGGVPTAMHTTSERSIAPPTSVVNCSRPSRWLRTTSGSRSEEHTSELQSRENLVCRPLLEKKKEREEELIGNKKWDEGGRDTNIER